MGFRTKGEARRSRNRKSFKCSCVHCLGIPREVRVRRHMKILNKEIQNDIQEYRNAA